MNKEPRAGKNTLTYVAPRLQPRYPSRGLHPDASDVSKPPPYSPPPKRRRRDGRDYYSNFKHYNQGPGERVAPWADPLSRVEINFHFYGAFRWMMFPPSMLLICKIFSIMDLFQRAGFTRR
jgi:hypothetical protein